MVTNFKSLHHDQLDLPSENGVLQNVFTIIQQQNLTIASILEAEKKFKQSLNGTNDKIGFQSYFYNSVKIQERSAKSGKEVIIRLLNMLNDMARDFMNKLEFKALLKPMKNYEKINLDFQRKTNITDGAIKINKILFSKRSQFYTRGFSNILKQAEVNKQIDLLMSTPGPIDSFFNVNMESSNLSWNNDQINSGKILNSQTNNLHCSPFTSVRNNPKGLLSSIDGYLNSRNISPTREGLLVKIQKKKHKRDLTGNFRIMARNTYCKEKLRVQNKTHQKQQNLCSLANRKIGEAEQKLFKYGYGKRANNIGLFNKVRYKMAVKCRLCFEKQVQNRRILKLHDNSKNKGLEILTKQFNKKLLENQKFLFQKAAKKAQKTLRATQNNYKKFANKQDRLFSFKKKTNICESVEKMKFHLEKYQISKKGSYAPILLMTLRKKELNTLKQGFISIQLMKGKFSKEKLKTRALLRQINFGSFYYRDAFNKLISSVKHYELKNYTGMIENKLLSKILRNVFVRTKYQIYNTFYYCLNILVDHKNSAKLKEKWLKKLIRASKKKSDFQETQNCFRKQFRWNCDLEVKTLNMTHRLYKGHARKEANEKVQKMSSLNKLKIQKNVDLAYKRSNKLPKMMPIFQKLVNKSIRNWWIKLRHYRGKNFMLTPIIEGIIWKTPIEGHISFWRLQKFSSKKKQQEKSCSFSERPKTMLKMESYYEKSAIIMEELNETGSIDYDYKESEYLVSPNRCFNEKDQDMPQTSQNVINKSNPYVKEKGKKDGHRRTRTPTFN